MTTSPTFTSSATRPSPSSFHRPGPAATTVPSWGFSLAVSGITRPDAVVWSPSFACTTIRSSSGWSLKSAISWVPPSAGVHLGWAPGSRLALPGLSANRIARRVPADKATSLTLRGGQQRLPYAATSHPAGAGRPCQVVRHAPGPEARIDPDRRVPRDDRGHRLREQVDHLLPDLDEPALDHVPGHRERNGE